MQEHFLERKYYCHKASQSGRVQGEPTKSYLAVLPTHLVPSYNSIKKCDFENLILNSGVFPVLSQSCIICKFSQYSFFGFNHFKKKMLKRDKIKQRTHGMLLCLLDSTSRQIEYLLCSYCVTYQTILSHLLKDCYY